MKKTGIPKVKAFAIAVLTAFSLCACNLEEPADSETEEGASEVTSILQTETKTAIKTVPTEKVSEEKTETTTADKTQSITPSETTAETTAKTTAETPTETTAETTAKAASQTVKPEESLPTIKIAEKDYIFGDDGLLITSEYDDNYLGNTYIFRADGKQITTKDTMAVWNDYLDYSLDNKKAAYVQSVGYQLFYISDEDMEPVFIDYHAQYFKIAPSGNGIAYSQNDIMPTFLYLWDGKESHLVSEYCYEPNAFYLSPDGQTVIYREIDDGEQSWHCYTDGKSTPIGADINPFAVTDNGEIIYYLYDEAIYAQKKNEQARLLYDMSAGETTFTFSFNKDRTEFMFALDSNLYISKDGGAAKLMLENIEAIEGDELPHLFPDKIAKTYGLDGVYGIDSFAGTFFTDKNLYYIDENFTMQSVITDIADNNEDGHYSREDREMNYNISRDGRIITYLKDNVIYRYDTRTGQTTTPFLIIAEAQFYLPAESGDALYYFNNAKAVYYAVPGGEMMLIRTGLTDYAEHWKLFAFDDAVIDGEKLYYISAGVVWCCDGEKETQISADGDYYTEITLQGGLIALTGIAYGDNITGNAVLTRDGTVIKTYEYK